MTRKKLRLLRDLLDELLTDEQKSFARDMGVDPDTDEFARVARKFLGHDLPRLGEIRTVEDVHIPTGSKRARDAEGAAAQFEANCRALRLKLQRGEK